MTYLETKKMVICVKLKMIIFNRPRQKIIMEHFTYDHSSSLIFENEHTLGKYFNNSQL